MSRLHQPAWENNKPKSSYILFVNTSLPLCTKLFFFSYSGCNSISIKEPKLYIQGKYLGPHYGKSLFRAGEDTDLSRRAKAVKGPTELWRWGMRFQQKTCSVPTLSPSLPRRDPSPTHPSPTPPVPSPPPRGQASAGMPQGIAPRSCCTPRSLHLQHQLFPNHRRFSETEGWEEIRVPSAAPLKMREQEPNRTQGARVCQRRPCKAEIII